MVAAGDKTNASDVNTVMPNSKAYSLFRTTTFDITTTTYADYTGATFTFTKRLASSGLLVFVGGSGYANGTAGYATTYGVNINGVDYDVNRYFWQVTATHYAFAGFMPIAYGLAVGTYTVQLRAKNAVATRTTRHDSSDTISLTVTEIP